MADTKRTVLYLDSDAADLLDQLAPGEKRRGKFVSELLRGEKARQERAGDDSSYAELGRRLAGLVLDAMAKGHDTANG